MKQTILTARAGMLRLQIPVLIFMPVEYGNGYVETEDRQIIKSNINVSLEADHGIEALLQTISQLTAKFKTQLKWT